MGGEEKYKLFGIGYLESFIIYHYLECSWPC